MLRNGDACTPDDPATSDLLVLDCGQGLVSIVALLQGWKHVTFADTSEEVLLQSTWPNVPQQHGCGEMLPGRQLGHSYAGIF